MVFNIKLNVEEKYEFSVTNEEINEILYKINSRRCLMTLLKKFGVMIKNDAERFRNVLTFYKFCGKVINENVKYRIVNTEFESDDIETIVEEIKNFWK